MKPRQPDRVQVRGGGKDPDRSFDSGMTGWTQEGSRLSWDRHVEACGDGEVNVESANDSSQGASRSSSQQESHAGGFQAPSCTCTAAAIASASRPLLCVLGAPGRVRSGRFESPLRSQAVPARLGDGSGGVLREDEAEALLALLDLLEEECLLQLESVVGREPDLDLSL